jgi:hypothetical protein
MNFKLLTGRENNKLQEYKGFLIYEEAIPAFEKLVNDAKKEINADIAIVSSFRDHARQLAGWNLKAQGKRPLYDDNDNPLDYNSMSEEEILFAILRWSAVPGGSRHHWGTDIDIFDANKMKREDVQLLQSECVPGGPCGDLHLWLDEKIQMNNSYGFFRPYETERDGVGCEKWHLSYSPISTLLNEAYTIDVFKKNIQESDLELKNVLLQNVELVFEKYVKNIDSPPF